MHIYLTIIVTLHEPHTYHEASTDPLWQIARKEELNALSKNHTWDLVTLYKIKTCFDGFIKHYKTRFVAKCFTQEYWVDYEETFASVAQISSIRAFLAVVVASKWDIF